MLKKLLIFIPSVLLAITGCVKETYDMDTLSGRGHLSPVLAISAVRGDISISDINEIPNDTVVFDEDNFIRIVFRKDSVIDLDVNDFDEFNELASLVIDETYLLADASLENIEDTLDFDPGSGIEIEEIYINTGVINYSITSVTDALSSFTITFPTVLREENIPVTHNISLPPNSTVTGYVSLDDTEVDFSTDTDQPFNRLPVLYTFEAVSGTYSLTDMMVVHVDIPAPGYEYVKGYFGQPEENFEEDTLDLEIEEILDNISGTFLLSDPSIRLEYSNSFSIPIEVDLKATGYRDEETVLLNLDPFSLSYPDVPAEFDISSSFTVDRDNSDLPELVSMPPEKVVFFGSALMNPGGNTGTRDNYIFDDSRFIGNLEIEVPLEFRMANLQFTDTTGNFIKIEDSSDSPANPEDFEFLRIDIEAENGFPLGVSLRMILYDSLTFQNIDTVSATDILKPAPVDATGRAGQPEKSLTSIEIDRHFWESAGEATNIIFSFTLNTTDQGTRDVKFYSDYGIDFRASLVLKPDFRFEF
ncbi:MAG: hypothetical protein JXR66_05755 [Bacteroidales bacterium]|nr:hypothetical protein [Bacteroidales bacterium]MBN2633038.1 hypothetical protein [Bacteroidales bacterium]